MQPGSPWNYPPPPPPSRTPWGIILVVAFLLLFMFGAMAAGAFFFLFRARALAPVATTPTVYAPPPTPTPFPTPTLTATTTTTAPPATLAAVRVVPVGGSPVRGKNDALVTIVEFSDFQCPYCKRVETTLTTLRGIYGDDLRIVWKNAPLAFHPHALPAAEVALEPPELPRMEVEAKGPARGPANAAVTIVEFSDFQCPYCGREFPVIERLMKEYDGKVRLVFRHFPLDFHPFAAKAAEAGMCAQDQGKFWELHDKMFTNQQKLAVEDLKGYAKSLGMDAAKFDKCLDSGEKKPAVDEDMKAGTAAGVNGTPAFFINGLFVNGAQPYEQMKQTIDRELKRKG